jgi:nucleotide-binding universal stress UspA family protein
MVQIRRILCPTDFSKPSLAALQYAADLGRRLGAELVLIHAIPPPAYPTARFAALSGFPDLLQEIRRRAHASMDQTRATVGAELQVKTIVREGTPHDEILAVAADQQCDLIVIATHGFTGLKHALLGSTAERVVRLSPIPVLTVRTPVHG